jgi:hypothetical protein
MEPSTIFMIASTIFKVGAGLQEGIAKEREAQLEAFNIGTERTLAKASANIDAIRRREELKDVMEAAESFFLRTREETMDIEAYYEREQDIAGGDIDDIAAMSYLNDLKYKQEIYGTRRRGVQERQASVVRAVGDVLQAGVDYYSTRQDRPSLVEQRKASPRPRLRPTSMR